MSTVTFAILTSLQQNWYKHIKTNLKLVQNENTSRRKCCRPKLNIEMKEEKAEKNHQKKNVS